LVKTNLLAIYYSAILGGVVYTCGENSYHQLGHQPPPPRLLAPAPVGGSGGRGGGGAAVKGAVGVAAGRYHSVYWTEESLYTWGLNAGQLGHLKVNWN
jgi:inhibitor of Bruton tyrosine kinase